MASFRALWLALVDRSYSICIVVDVGAFRLALVHCDDISKSTQEDMIIYMYHIMY